MNRIFESIIECICLINFENKIVYANNALLEKVQWDVGQPLGKYLNIDGIDFGRVKNIILQSVGDKSYRAKVIIDKIMWHDDLAYCLMLSIEENSDKNYKCTTPNEHKKSTILDFNKIKINVSKYGVENYNLDKIVANTKLEVDFSAVVNKKGMYLFVTPTVKSILGWEVEEIVSKNWKEFAHPEDLENIKAQEQFKSQNNNKYTITSRTKHKTHGYRWIQWQFKQYKDTDTTFVTAEDITEHTEYFRKQLAKDKEQEVERIYTNFLSVISHELRTPLALVQSTSMLIKEDISYSNYLRLKKNLNRLTRLVNNLISMVELTNGKYQIKCSRCNIVGLIYQISDHITGKQQFKNLTINIENNLNVDEIICDLYYIKKVILNILSNAVKHSNPDGNLNIILDEDEEFIVISIINFGRTIPEPILENIFEPFMQVDQILTRRNEGIGIGLYLSNIVVKMHNGELSVKSENENTCFSMRLPKNNSYENHGKIKIQNNMYDTDLENDILLELSDV
ncbi:MAG: hypothetical protein BEN19_05535 [Epulopiscium sp. Nuni2H_MBin003]|nr:MAG: hypothetical protein BEN19_05535 [Epulopiscium sp. Nuni2H_MBin003]